MSHIVPVLLVKHIVRDLAEATTPEKQAFIEGKPYALQEECVLQTAIVFEMCIASEGSVQALHA